MVSGSKRDNGFRTPEEWKTINLMEKIRCVIVFRMYSDLCHTVVPSLTSLSEDSSVISFYSENYRDLFAPIFSDVPNKVRRCPL